MGDKYFKEENKIKNSEREKNELKRWKRKINHRKGETIKSHALHVYPWVLTYFITSRRLPFRVAFPGNPILFNR